MTEPSVESKTSMRALAARRHPGAVDVDLVGGLGAHGPPVDVGHLTHRSSGTLPAGRPYCHRRMDEVSVTVNAPAEKVYDLLADIAQMGRWSPECTGGRWVGGATEAAVGARFKGSNRHGLMRWTTNCEVTKAERGKAFEWQVKESGMRWGYRFEPDGDGGTVVTEYREPHEADAASTSRPFQQHRRCSAATASSSSSTACARPSSGSRRRRRPDRHHVDLVGEALEGVACRGARRTQPTSDAAVGAGTTTSPATGDAEQARRQVHRWTEVVALAAGDVADRDAGSHAAAARRRRGHPVDQLDGRSARRFDRARREHGGVADPLHQRHAVPAERVVRDRLERLEQVGGLGERELVGQHGGADEVGEADREVPRLDARLRDEPQLSGGGRRRGGGGAVAPSPSSALAGAR